MTYKTLCVTFGVHIVRDAWRVRRPMFALYCGMSKMYSDVKAGLSKLYHHDHRTPDHNVTENDSKRKFTVAVEGNIGSGKTLLLQHFAECPFAEVHPEPVSKWRDIQGHNALGMMYKDSSRWSLTFQTYVQLTMLEQHTAKQKKPIKMMERSIFSAKYCFVENLYRSGKMPELEYIVLTKWFDWILANQDTHIDLIVYLRTTPETVFERIKNRCRKEETAIPMDYLTQLHNLHEDWLINQTKFSVNAPVLVLDANEGHMEMIDQYENNKQRILCGYS